MKVGFSPSVSFKSNTNLIHQKVEELKDKPNGQIVYVRPDTWESANDEQKKQTEAQITMQELEKTLEEGKSIDGIIRGTHWEKTYDRSDNTVHMKIPNSYDGAEYTIKGDGTVIRTSGWSNPEVVMDANEKMADYVKAMKNNKVEEYLTKLDEKIQEPNGDFKVTDKSKAELFNEALHSRHWKKEYLPESDLIVVHHKKNKDSVEYMMEKDGTVKECGPGIEPTVIIEPSVDGAKQFGKLKTKLNDDPQEKTSLWYKMKSGVSNIWKFFTVSKIMAAATTKGIVQGTVGAVGVLAATTIVRGAVAIFKNQKTFMDIVKNPLKTSGKLGGALALVAAAGCIAVNVIEGRMKANQNSAVIEHKLDVAHDLT